jgi:hypothetical protein
LIELKERAEGFIGREIIIGEDRITNYEPYWDFIIKIDKMI